MSIMYRTMNSSTNNNINDNDDIPYLHRVVLEAGGMSDPTLDLLWQ